MKKHSSFPQEPHPKLEITGTFDLFLNTDLCECVFSSVDNRMEKNGKISRTRNLIMLSVQSLLGCMKDCTNTQMHCPLFTDMMHIYCTVHVHMLNLDD